MYMRNNNQNRYSKYNINDFPTNYSGQYTKESLIKDDYINETEHDKHEEHIEHKDHKEHISEEREKERDDKKGHSLLSGLFGGHKDNKDNKDEKKGGILSGLFGKKDGKDGGILSGIELEDLILIAVIFFLLKDGIEDDLILILAIILFSS